MSLLDKIDARFRSGNSVPVERTNITASEWAELRATLEAAEADRSSVPAPRYIEERTDYICDQLSRYAGKVASDELADVLYDIVEINDDMWHGRIPQLIRERIEKVRAGLDVVLAAYLKTEAE